MKTIRQILVWTAFQLRQARGRAWLLSFLCLSSLGMGQPQKSTLAFTVSMKEPRTHLYHVRLQCRGLDGETLDFKMPVWTPGYYQLMNYAQNVENFQAVDKADRPLKWEKVGNSTWRVHLKRRKKQLTVTYAVKATRDFVAGNYLDETKGFISPAGLFMYVDGQIKHPVTVTVQPYVGWKDLVATGLDSLPGQHHTFVAPDFDILYDSPMLMGQLEQLPSFAVQGVPHYFVGYNLGNFDRTQFVADLKKIVEGSAAVIGDIPYKHYTFLAIGPGGGGIEHLNSTAISFDGTGLNTRSGRLRLYNFLAHEYFHHYNVKRIRPVELGPFNYDAENRTRMLWVSEGFTVYYPYLILNRAGLMTGPEVFQALQANLVAYENKPGHRFQSATQASYETWEDGPFGRTGDDAYKTISYYAKGPVLGALLDFKIRHETQNKKSLDDVMRALYEQFYQQQKRGFTESEFQSVCEEVAGTSLAELFAYASTVKAIDYSKYFAYAGLAVASEPKPQPGSWLGLTLQQRGDSVVVSSVEVGSPAWMAGIRNRAVVLQVNGQSGTARGMQEGLKSQEPGDTIGLLVRQDGQPREVRVVLEQRAKASFEIRRLPNPTPLQAAILRDWLPRP